MIRLWLIGCQLILTARAKHQGPDYQKEECQADSHFFHRSSDFSVLANAAITFPAFDHVAPTAPLRTGLAWSEVERSSRHEMKNLRFLLSLALFVAMAGATAVQSENLAIAAFPN